MRRARRARAEKTAAGWHGKREAAVPARRTTIRTAAVSRVFFTFEMSGGAAAERRPAPVEGDAIDQVVITQRISLQHILRDTHLTPGPAAVCARFMLSVCSKSLHSLERTRVDPDPCVCVCACVRACVPCVALVVAERAGSAGGAAEAADDGHVWV